MSDPPPGEQPPVNPPIPGLSEQLSRLSSIASRAGFRLASIVFTPYPATTVPPPPPTVTFTNPMPSTILHSPPTTYPAPADPTSASVHVSPKPPPNTRPLSAPSTSSPTLSQLATKRPSPSAQELPVSSSQHVPSQSKRMRATQPEIASSERTTAFWGTVLEQRSAAPATFAPSSAQLQALPLPPTPNPPPSYQHSQPQSAEYFQRGQPPLAGPSTHRFPTTDPLENPRPFHQPQPQPYVQLPRRKTPLGVGPVRTVQQDYGTLQRVATLPYIPPRSTRSSETPSPPAHSLPGLQRSFSVRHPTISGLLHRTGSFLARVSPFPSSTLATQSSQPPSGAAPPVFPTLGRNLERLEQREPLQPSGYDPIQRQGLLIPPNRSPSQSASASNVSQARPASIPTSPRTPSSRAVERGETFTAGSIENPTSIMAGPSQLPSGRGRRPSTQQSAPGAQLFSCPLCNAKFGRKSDKTRHVRVVHDKSRPFSCAICGKKFGEKSNMLKHRASVHDDVRIFRCPYCDMSFSQRAMCDNHVRSVHDKKQAKYFCEQCGLPFSRKLLLHDHYRDSHPPLLEAYQLYEAASADAEAAEAGKTVASEAAGSLAAAASSSGASAGRSAVQSGGEVQGPSHAGDDSNEDEITPVYTTQQRQRPRFSGYGQPSRSQPDDRDDLTERSGEAAPKRSRQVFGRQAVESLLQQGTPSIVQGESMDFPMQRAIEAKEDESIQTRHRREQEEIARIQRLDLHVGQRRGMSATSEAMQGVERVARHARAYDQQHAYQQAGATQPAQPQQSQSRIQNLQRSEHVEQSEGEDNSGHSVR